MYILLEKKKRFLISSILFVFQENEEPRFDGAGYDKDLVEGLERDIVQKNPNVRWYRGNTYFDFFLNIRIQKGTY